MEEPVSARPCATPHSAPLGWLRAEPAAAEAADPPPPPQTDDAPAAPRDLTAIAQHLRSDPEALADFIERVSPEQQRGDGWSPFLRKLFLQVVAETGKVVLACQHTGMSRQSAYALAARDPLFAAGWDAAAMLARRPLADDIFEKSIDGVTDTVTRNGEVVATRRRYDSRLSIAVLNRLDRRCERAEERGEQHLALMRHWDEWLKLLGTGETEAAAALLEPPPAADANLCQNCQVPESANPIPNPPGYDPGDNVWKVGAEDASWRRSDHGLPDGTWMTTYPPPPGFDGYESGTWDGFNYYERACTADEAELLDAHQAAMEEQEQAELAAFAEAERDGWFARLRAELGAARRTVGDPTLHSPM